MDAAEDILSLVPLRHLSHVFITFKLFWQNIQQVQVNQEQFLVLAHCIAQLLQTLDQEYRVAHLVEHITFQSLEEFRKLLAEIAAFVRKETNQTFFQSLLNKDDTISRIEIYHTKIALCARAFQLPSLLATGQWQSRKDDARKMDQQKLRDRLRDLETNQANLAEVLNMHDSDPTPIAVCLQRRLNDQSDIQQFFSHVLQYVNTWSGFSVEVENWMITSYEVEFGHRIGFGGFGEVYKGVWNEADVAIKVLRTKCGITPSPTAIRREIQIWSELRHTNILQFFGANEWGDRPFIVMPYLKNGNARDYVRAYPDCNRLRIIHHVSLGLIYLHAQNIVHGDLKALNVLIDNGGNAVLCDFGLSRIKADVTTRSSIHEATSVVGSRNWLAPEILLGGSPKRPGDIYALGMTIYEIFADEVPLSGLDNTSFIDVVVEKNVRPERPDEEDTPQLSDAIWELAEWCWIKDARKRPTAKAVSNTISPLLENCIDIRWMVTTDSVAPTLRPLPAIPLTDIQQKPLSQQSLSSRTQLLPPASIISTKALPDIPISTSTMAFQGTVEIKSPALLSNGSRIVSENIDASSISHQQPPYNAHNINSSLVPPSGPSRIVDRIYSTLWQRRYRLCTACESPMEGAFVCALGSVFHLRCFKCMDCGDVVASKFFPVKGTDGQEHPLCERDYFLRLNLICGKCNCALRGSYITACDKKFHVEHFTCSICPTLFGPKDNYYEHDGDVYCHFHYSMRFANKCFGCTSAILKQFVEIQDKTWHPECYMIHKFWKVKIMSPSSNGQEDAPEPSYVKEEQQDTPTSLKDKQERMEQQAYRIWTVLSAFEESSAACISDMLQQVTNGQYFNIIQQAEKFILHVEALFAVIDDLEYHVVRLNMKGITHAREARMLCRKTVGLFTLLSGKQETASRMGMTQQLLALVTDLAHYLKILIRIALTSALKFEREQNLMGLFLDKLHLLVVQGGNPHLQRVVKGAGAGEMFVQRQGQENPGTTGVAYGFRSLAPESAGESPFTSDALSSSRDPGMRGLSMKNPPSDLCVKCNLTVEEDCVRLGTYQRWHSDCIQCIQCGKVAAEIPSPKPSDNNIEGDKGPKMYSNARRPPANVGLFVYEVHSMKNTKSFGNVPTVIFCIDHGNFVCEGGFQPVSRLEQYAFLLNVALRRLYLLLKKQGLISLSAGVANDSITD